MSLLLLVAVLAPAAAALAAAASRDATRGPRLVAGATGLAAACAAALLAHAASRPASEVIQASVLIGELRADRLVSVLLVLTLGISAMVQSFARRSLLGDARAGRFAILAGSLTSTAAATSAATTLVGLAVAWSATSLLLCALIALYRGYEAAEIGVRRTAVALAIGDAALWLAVAVLVARFGALELRDLPGAAAALDPAATTAIAALVLVAAAARSVQIPFNLWLPATLASPTPVSALLHAGVVNAGAILLILLAPLLAAAPAVLYGAALLGAITAAVGTALMLTRPDIKGALAHSTVAQMGFMMFTCGLGLWAAAVLHLVAHGAYKSARFLGSGRSVSEINAARISATGHAAGTPWTLVTAATIAGIPLVVSGVLLEVPTVGIVPLGFAWAALTLAGRGWIDRMPGAGGVAAFSAASVICAPLYALLTEGAAHFLAPALPGSIDGSPSLWLALPAAVLLAAVPACWARGPAGLRDRLYAWALTVGDGSRPDRRRRGTPAPVLVLDQGIDQ